MHEGDAVRQPYTGGRGPQCGQEKAVLGLIMGPSVQAGDEARCQAAVLGMR